MGSAPAARKLGEAVVSMSMAIITMELYGAIRMAVSLSSAFRLCAQKSLGLPGIKCEMAE